MHTLPFIIIALTIMATAMVILNRVKKLDVVSSQEESVVSSESLKPDLSESGDDPDREIHNADSAENSGNVALDIHEPESQPTSRGGFQSLPKELIIRTATLLAPVDRASLAVGSIRLLVML
ncbi:hypothetical protein IL306_015190 [Fusarium sp. DS 682]|nr:hypothetical protein IL306_015190 [Fusarium sp. DS 682]